MTTRRIIAYETSEECSEDGGPIQASVDSNGNFKHKTADYVEGTCTRCHQISGVSRMHIDENAPIYEGKE